MVDIALTINIPAYNGGDANMIYATVVGVADNAGVAVTQWNIDGDTVTASVRWQGEFSPLPFMTLYGYISAFCPFIELEYTGTVHLPDGVEYDIEGEASIVDGSWKHNQRAGAYVGDNE